MHISYEAWEVISIVAVAFALTFYKAWRDADSKRARMVRFIESRNLESEYLRWDMGLPPQEPPSVV